MTKETKVTTSKKPWEQKVSILAGRKESEADRMSKLRKLVNPKGY